MEDKEYFIEVLQKAIPEYISQNNKAGRTDTADIIDYFGSLIGNQTGEALQALVKQGVVIKGMVNGYYDFTLSQSYYKSVETKQ